MKIYLGADHRGYKLKENVKTYLEDQGYEIKDMGTDSEESTDYPLIAEAVGKRVASTDGSRGILICGSGGGVCIAANKIKGIRAAEAWNSEKARADRNDDDVNVLCLSGDRLELEEAKSILDSFINTDFEGVERRIRRLKQIKELEDA